MEKSLVRFWTLVRSINRQNSIFWFLSIWLQFGLDCKVTSLLPYSVHNTCLYPSSNYRYCRPIFFRDGFRQLMPSSPVFNCFFHRRTYAHFQQPGSITFDIRSHKYRLLQSPMDAFSLAMSPLLFSPCHVVIHPRLADVHCPGHLMGHNQFKNFGHIKWVWANEIFSIFQ